MSRQNSSVWWVISTWPFRVKDSCARYRVCAKEKVQMNLFGGQLVVICVDIIKRAVVVMLRFGAKQHPATKSTGEGGGPFTMGYPCSLFPRHRIRLPCTSPRRARPPISCGR